MVEFAAAEEVGVLLFLQHLHHIVDELSMRRARANPEIHLALLTHLDECLFHFKLASKLVILNSNYTEEN